MKPCKSCALYENKRCKWGISKEERKQNIEEYDFDCFCTHESLVLCELMCGCVEED